MTLTEEQLLEEINKSQLDFDMASGLTEDELRMAGMLTTLPDSTETPGPLLKDLDEVDDQPVDIVALVSDDTSYNVQYAHYVKCQTLADLMAFDEGWKNFEDMVLKAYMQQRRAEDADYRGEDPNKAFSLRIRKQAAEDFVKFIRMAMTEAAATPKPVLARKKKR